MATVVGGFTTSHIPAIGGAIAKSLFDDPYWKPFFDGYPPVRAWLDRVRPDVAIVIYNDHGLNFFLDKMPAFALGAAPEYRNEDEGWGIPTIDPFPGDPEFSWHLINGLAAADFDLCTCQEMAVDHGFTVPMQLAWPDRAGLPRAVPIAVNTVQHPIPSPQRCYNFGKALGRAIASYDKDIKVVILGTGGLSHQLDGKRAGYINKAFDQMCMERIVDDADELAQMSTHELIEQAGAQGTEFVNWLMMRGALSQKVTKLHSNYHIPISNTAAGLLLLETA